MELIFKSGDDSLIVKYNPYHDERGRFSSASGGAGFATYSADRNTPINLDDFKNSSILSHLDENGKIKPERLKLYNRIINESLKGVEKPEGKPTADFMGGGGGSGKGYVIHAGVIDIPKGNQAVYVNSDDIKLKFPEFKKLAVDDNPDISKSAANFVHEESSLVARMLTTAALKKGVNVVVDGTAKNPEKVKAQVEEAHKHGYKVNAHFVTAPVDVALESNRKRYYGNDNPEERRYVPDAAIIQAHKDVSRNFTKLSSLFDSMELVNNDKIHKPERIAYKDEKTGKIVAANEDEYAKFLAKQYYGQKIITPML